ncbi:hypothetical protein [Streptomyces sp. NPDC101150]
MGEQSREGLERMAAVAHHHGGNAPMAALLLDMAIYTGRLGIVAET